MQELQRQIDGEIKRLLGKENQLLSDLFKYIVEDYAYLWQYIDDLQKIRRIFIVIVKLFIKEYPDLSSLSDDEKRRFRRDFDELITSPIALLEKSKELQIKEIEGLTPKKWISRFRSDIEDILYIIAHRYRFSPETGRPVKIKIIKVPFYTQGMYECGPTALRMVLKYFGYEMELQRVKQLCAFSGATGTPNTGIALGAAKMGLKAECFFKSMSLDDETFLKNDFFKKHPEKIPKAREFFLQLRQECKSLGVALNEQYMPTDEILARLSENSIPIVCVDAAKFYGAQKAMPHLVVVVGCNSDKSIVYINDPARAPFVSVSTLIFDKARESKAADGEVVIISRK